MLTDVTRALHFYFSSHSYILFSIYIIIFIIYILFFIIYIKFSFSLFHFHFLFFHFSPKRCKASRRLISWRVLRCFDFARRHGYFPWVHAEKSFPNLIESNWNQIVVTIFLLIWNQTVIRLIPNQSEKGKYNLISVWFNKISKRFLCV